MFEIRTIVFASNFVLSTLDEYKHGTSGEVLPKHHNSAGPGAMGAVHTSTRKVYLYESHGGTDGTDRKARDELDEGPRPRGGLLPLVGGM